MLWKTGTLKHFPKFSGKYLCRSPFFSLHVVVLHFNFIKNVLLQFLQYFAEQVFDWRRMTNSNFFLMLFSFATFINLLFNQNDVGLNTVARRWHLSTSSHLFFKKSLSWTKNCHELFRDSYNCRELLPDSYNCRKLLLESYNSCELLPDRYNCCELLPHSYNCRELIPDSYKCRELLPDSYNFWTVWFCEKMNKQNKSILLQELFSSDDTQKTIWIEQWAQTST